MPSSKLKNKPKLERTTSHNQYEFEAIGTHWSIKVCGQDDYLKQNIIDAINYAVEVFDKSYSRFRSDSLITKISKSQGRYILPVDAKALFDFYYKLYDVTGGLFTPLIGQMLVDAGYDANYSLKPGAVGDVEKLSDVIEYDYPVLSTKSPVLIDLGAAGKGYLVDIVSSILYNNGIKQYSVNGGGDIYNYHLEVEDRSVGLENPLDQSEVIAVAEVSTGSICGSAGNRRKWSGYHHIINPSTKKSPSDIIATWVYSSSAMLADGISTALFLVSPNKLKSYFKFEYALIRSDLSLEYSSNFPGSFYN